MIVNGEWSMVKYGEDKLLGKLIRIKKIFIHVIVILYKENKKT